MDAQATKTILLGVILVILVVPFGGPAAPYGIAIVVALVLFDLWRQQIRKSKGPAASGTPVVWPGQQPPAPGDPIAASGYCPRCGEARTAGARFCPKCGLDPRGP